MFVKIYFEPDVEPIFHPDSYGYRPEKSAIKVVGRARERCWNYDWGLDLDIGGVVSPRSPNLFLHDAFDDWMRRRYPEIPSERYADDVMVHCKTEAERGS
jgi:RNA-directed DNA polymerase